LQVAALQLQNMVANERLNASAQKNKELTAERQKTHVHNQQLIRCVVELTAISKSKEGTLKQLRHCIQNAEQLVDIPLPPIEQVRPLCMPFIASRMCTAWT